MRVRRILCDALVLGTMAAISVPQWANTSGGRLIEDFSSDTYADYSSTTGFWDLPGRRARAAVYTDATGSGTARPVTFGDGSDGVLDSANGATFNTDLRPNGFNYRSVNISAGTITVTGSNPLVIRSLTTMNIAAGVTFSLDGAGDVAGSLGGAANGTTTRAAAAATPTCASQGGAGGSADASTSTDGGDGLLSDGTPDLGSGGLRNDDSVLAGDGGNGSPTAAALPTANDFDTTGFICGPGGAGGGGDTAGNGVGDYATGGAGGSGGGRVRLISAGDMTIGTTITARGGTAGRGAGAGTACSGSGAGGNGGAVWLQTLRTLTTVAPDVSFGTGNGTPCNAIAAPVDGNNGASRSDQAGVGANGTTLAPASQTYVIQSKAYDLDTLNAGFSEAPTVSASAGGGSTPSVEYAGSIDGSTFSDFTSDITQLNGKDYRYLKFRITIRTGGVAAATPEVTRIEIPYKDLGYERLELKLSPGCGNIKQFGGKTGGTTPRLPGFAQAAPWVLFWSAAYIVLRYCSVRNTRRLPSRKLPT